MQAFFEGLDWSVPVNMLISVIPALVCITLHELSHGWVAYRLGDPTAKLMGRLTLNPVKHIDIFGLVMMIVFKFGWAKPVPVDMRNFKNPKTGMAICAAAGPLCNLVLAAVLLFVYGVLVLPLTRTGAAVADVILQTVGTTAYLSVALAIFNVIPISPLDGSKVLFSFLSERNYYRLMRYERYGMILLLALVYFGNRLPFDPLGNAAGWVFDKLFILAEWGFSFSKKIFL